MTESSGRSPEAILQMEHAAKLLIFLEIKLRTAQHLILLMFSIQWEVLQPLGPFRFLRYHGRLVLFHRPISQVIGHNWYWDPLAEDRKTDYIEYS